MKNVRDDVDDRLVWLLNRYELKAHIFQAGPLANPSSHDTDNGLSYIHVLRAGKLLLETTGEPAQLLEEPFIFLYMTPANHRLIPKDDNVNLICASFDFGANLKNPLVKALPEKMLLKQQDIPALNEALDFLFNEAEEEHCGRQAILNRQIEVVIILLLRDLMDQNRLEIGLLAGLADLKLAKAINAMHAQPEKNWSLEELAEKSCMSRARFATKFRDIVGMTPGNYFTEWRIGIAQSLLSRGKPVQLIADTVGYSSASAFSRVFTAHVGKSPTDWKKQYLSKFSKQL